MPINPILRHQMQTVAELMLAVSESVSVIKQAAGTGVETKASRTNGAFISNFCGHVQSDRSGLHLPFPWNSRNLWTS